VILGKMAYYREGGSEKHLRDIAGILKVSGDAAEQSSDMWEQGIRGSTAVPHLPGRPPPITDAVRV